MQTPFSEVLAHRNELLHRWAIWQELYEHLEKFTDTDVRKAEMGIKTEGEGLVVPQDLIVESREFILAEMAEIRTLLAKLESREVAEYDDEEEDDEEDAVEGGEGEESEDGEQDPEEGPVEAEGDD